MSKKTKKGKTMALTDFLASEPKLVTVRDSTWAAIVAEEEEEQKKAMVVDMSNLPTAPRAAVDIDYSTLPNNPPFVAHVGNLSFEIDDENLRRIFADLNPIAARIMREGTRSRGVGLVEFTTRENLIEALKRTDKEIYGRRIRINVSDKTDLHQNDNNRSNFGYRQNRMGGEERPEMSDRWKRIERRSDELSEDRPRNDFNRDRPNRNDHGRSNFSGQSRDGQRGGDYGFGYPRTRDDRGHDRQGPRQRYNNDDEHRQNPGSDKPRYAGRQSDPRERETPNDDNREPQKERPRLQLQPRSKPLEEFQPLSGSSSSVNIIAASSSPSNTEESPNLNDHSTNNPDEYRGQESHDTSDVGSSIEPSTVKPLAPSRGAGASIFGGAKPVDTATKELEIEKKIKELQLASSEAGDDQNEKPQSSRPTYHRTNDRDNYRNQDRDHYRQKRPSHNDDYHNRDRRDDGRSGHGPDYHHKREYSGGRRYEEDSRRPSGGGDDDYHRRERDRYNNNPSRRDQGSGKYNHPDRDNYRHRDSNEHNNHRRTSNDSFTSETQSKPQPKILARRPVGPTEDDSNKLQLSNKFVMLDDDDLTDNHEAQSPTIEN